jgi:hypothetical protein
MIYTNEQWEKDRNFSAEPFQEIEESIYYYFLECLPPYYGTKTPEGTENYHGIFRCSEPVNHVNGLPVYHCFGKQNDKYYYLGLRR